MTRTVTAPREVKTRNILCWGMGDIFGSGAMTITGLWLLYFYIEVAGLSPAAAASIFAIAKIWDGITDPIMGYITDNIRTRWGRRRLFFIIGAPYQAIVTDGPFPVNNIQKGQIGRAHV